MKIITQLLFVLYFEAVLATYAFSSYMLVSSHVISVVLAPVDFAFFKKAPGVLHIFTSIASFFVFLHTINQIATTIKSLEFRGRGRWYKIAWRILWSLDIIAVVPHRWLADCTHYRWIRYFIWMRLLRLRYFYRWDLIAYMKIKGTAIFFLVMVYRALRIILISVLWIHIVASILYYTAAASETPAKSWLAKTKLLDISFDNFEDMNFRTVYTVSFYFASVIILPLGLRHAHPRTLIEMDVILWIVFVSRFILVIVANMTIAAVAFFNSHTRALNPEYTAKRHNS